MENKELSIGNFLIAAQSFINALDELKGTPLYQSDIKIETNKLLTKVQSRFKKQFKNMFTEENAEITMNILKDYERFNYLVINEKQLIFQMADYYKQDPEFWQENFVMFFDKLNKK